MKIILLISCAALSTGLLAQRSTSKKVDTRFINVPNYDVGSTEIGSLKSSFAIGNSVYGSQKLKDTKTTCVVKGGSLKDAKEVTTYYYDIEVTRPSSFLFLKDEKGNTVYAHQLATESSDKAEYGKGKCEFWMKPSLEKSYKADEAAWKESNHGTYTKNLKQKAEIELSRNALVSSNPIEIDVYSAKGRNFDYSEIEEAYELAYNAYEDISEKGISSENFDKLVKAIAIWESELEKADLEDKDARINEKVAQGLYINLTYAYFTMFAMDDAAVYAQKADQSFGNFTNNKRVEIQQLRKDVNRRKAGINKNLELIKDPDKMNEIAKQSNSTKFVLENYSGTMDDAGSDYFKFAGEEMNAIAEASEEANIEGGGTSYDKYIMPNSVPMTLSIMRIQETLTEFPIEITKIDGLGAVIINANTIETIPAQIGNMSSLKKLYLSNNKITELPVEIGNCTSLKNLDLSGNPIDKLPESIKNCSNLKKLKLKKTNISDEHAEEIESWLPNCKIKI